MKNIWNIAIRDFRAYFTSPIAYILIAGFMGIMGWMFFFNLSHFNMQSMQHQQFNMGKAMSITDGILRPLYGNMNVVFLFMVPFITMRLFAEERKQSTIALLLTAPLTQMEIISGKFLSALMLVKVMLGLTLVYPVILFITGNPELGPVVTNYIGTIFMVSCYISVGVFCSSLTENQIVAGAMTFAINLFFWLIGWASQSAGPVLGDVINHLSTITHYNNFGQGLLNSTDVIYYLSHIGFGLFLTHRVLDSYRWR